jgi:hypothetical protein
MPGQNLELRRQEAYTATHNAENLRLDSILSISVNNLPLLNIGVCGPTGRLAAYCAIYGHEFKGFSES